MTAYASDPAVKGIAAFFEDETGQTLGESRLWRVETALRPLLRDNQIASLTDLLQMLRRDPNGAVAAGAIHALMNHESSFFRDINLFRVLEHQLLPHLFETMPEKTVRIWCAGCSTGQEAYSLGMLFARDERWRDWRISILGTDVSPFAIAQAEQGVYAQIDIQRGLPISDLMRFMVPRGDEWQVNPELRQMVSFRTDNILRPQTVSGFFDIIFCRNVMLYFPPDLRSYALGQIARACRPGTVLVLGAGETMIGSGTAFQPAAGFRGLYQLAAPVHPVTATRLAG